jgi:uncharacterized membrane protein YphA (DoxX/SURF4 family)
MNIALWIVAVVLAVAFGAAGFLKVTTPKQKLAENMDWVEDFSERTVKLIGVAEILGAVGLVLPAALDIVPVLTPLAASGLTLVMVLAAATHARRKELPMIGVNVVLGGLALFVAIMRFGSQSF